MLTTRELRLTGRDGIARALYVTAIGRRVVVIRAFAKKTQRNAARRDRTRAPARKGHHMTIQFEKLKARLLANPKVKAEYDALAPEFEIAAELLKARLRAGLSQAELADTISYVPMMNTAVEVPNPQHAKGV
ncbi:type II toxin-antitoxin system RelE/ParE family toxin [Bradyrhizobium sediminis]|uniref:type II toxin-antitoxin system RelE/ParE family toxin n=1 Tax=Bradyrhizobium sediminis TaxID=2840469 RepID=UPI00201BDC59|nr:type II toxin-antitoxin system RelE/ParE family toxin [Bradyrhizobium sediminis]